MVAVADPKIETIVAELIRRIKTAYPRHFIQRGFFGDENTIWPAIYINEDVEQTTSDRTKRRGMYDRTASVMISLFFKGPSDLQQAMATANIEKNKLCFAIELDDDFEGMCTHYGEVEFDKVFYKSNGIQVAVEYQFQYSEMAPWQVTNARRM